MLLPRFRILLRNSALSTARKMLDFKSARFKGCHQLVTFNLAESTVLQQFAEKTLKEELKRLQELKLLLVSLVKACIKFEEHGRLYIAVYLSTQPQRGGVCVCRDQSAALLYSESVSRMKLSCWSFYISSYCVTQSSGFCVCSDFPPCKSAPTTQFRLKSTRTQQYSYSPADTAPFLSITRLVHLLLKVMSWAVAKKKDPQTCQDITIYNVQYTV